MSEDKEVQYRLSAADAEQSAANRRSNSPVHREACP